MALADGVLENLVGSTIVEHPNTGAIGDDSLGVGVGAVKREATGSRLNARDSTCSTRMLENFIGLVVDDPNIGTVCGDSLDYRSR